jgi:hypothetical protein
MSATLVTPKTTSGGEIIRELVNATDGAGLHFDGAAGNIDIASPPDLGTKFSFEFVLSAVDWATASYRCIIDFGSSGRFRFGQETAEGSGTNLSIYDTDNRDFGVSVLDDGKVHHLVVTVDGTAAVLYDNGNQVGTTTLGATPTIDSAADARIGSNFIASSGFFNGTIYRCRFYNKALTSTEVQTAYERADVDYSSQYGTANVITTAAWQNWGTNQADTGNDTNDRATFNSNYGTSGPTLGWGASGSPINISVASNVLTFSATSDAQGIHYALPASTLVAGKTYRLTIATGSITGTAKARLYGSSSNVSVNLEASKTNVCEFVAPVGVVQYFYILLFGGTAETPATIQLNAASVSNDFAQIGAVSDYDLAFANPTQSRMVQDRSGAADGTCSASGVTQVQPIIQGNLTSLRVGTGTAATPADNQVLVDGGTVGAPAYAFTHTTNTGMWSRGGGKLDFATGGVTRIAINSDGQVGLGVTASAWAGTGKALQLAGTSHVATANNYAYFGSNYYYENNWKYTTAAKAAIYTQSDGTHDFRVAAAGSNPNDLIPWNTALTIDSSGTVLIKRNASSDAATVAGHTIADGIINSFSAAGKQYRFYETSGSGQEVGHITVSSSATTYSTSSDYRLKENLTPLTGALDRLDALPVYRFNFTADPDTTVDGFVAHEVQAHVPEAITGEKDAMRTVVVQEAVEAVEAQPATNWEEGDELPEGVAVGDEKTAAVEAVEAVEKVTEEQPDYQGIDQSKLVPLLVAAVKELKAKVETLENA